MNHPRTLGSLAVASTIVGLVAVSACGDEFETAASAGTGGAAGSAGSAGSAGGAGSAGSAGSAGAAGMAGTGAAAGMAGTGGTVTGGSGGAAGSGGTGGAAGSGGSAGSAGSAGGPSCTGTFGGVQLMGTIESDSAWDVATDSAGSVYIVGYTRGSLHGQNHQGAADVYIMQIDSAGVRQWTQQLGTQEDDFGTAIDVGASLYVVGNTQGEIDGQPLLGNTDAFITAYSKAGAKQWTRAFGSIGTDKPADVAVNQQNDIFVVGETAGSIDNSTYAGDADMFFVKFDGNGSRSPATVLGTSERDVAWGISVGLAGSLLVTGESWGDFEGYANQGSSDLFVLGLDPTGVQNWKHMFGGATYDRARAIVETAQGIYIAGYTASALGGQPRHGGADFTLLKYSTSGVREWTKVLGTALDERAFDIAADPEGNVYVAGESSADFGGQANQGGKDAVVAKFDPDGNPLWTVLLGTSVDEEANSITIDEKGCIFVVGYSVGDLAGNVNAGGYDLFIASLDPDGHIR